MYWNSIYNGLALRGLFVFKMEFASYTCSIMEERLSERMSYHVKNVVVKVVQVAAGVFVGVAMNDAVKKYVVEPLQKKIDSKHGEA